jgi:hypothetical protein
MAGLWAEQGRNTESDYQKEQEPFNFPQCPDQPWDTSRLLYRK